MSIIVEHEKRRNEILEHSLDVFVDEGFENATFQKIADRSGITRTTLYIYFKNKREIFKYSIKMLLEKIEYDIQYICEDVSLNSIEKITKVMLGVLQHLEQNRRLLSVIFHYLLYITKSTIHPEKRIRRRVVKMRHILASLVIEGIKKGELKKIKIKTADDFLYSFIEAAIFRLVVLRCETAGDLRTTAVFAVNELAAH